MDDKLSIARIFYPVKTLGPGNRVGIWTTGCLRGCQGCISPELQDYDKEKPPKGRSFPHECNVRTN